MSDLLLITPDSDASASYLYNYSPFPELSGALYAGYLHATSVSAAPLTDLSGNGRTATLGAGAGASALGLIAGSTNFLLTPFTDAQLRAVSGGLTLISIAAIPDANTATEIASLRLSPSADGLGLFAKSANTGKIEALDIKSGTSNTLDLTTTTARDASFEFHAATFSGSGKSLYRRRAAYASAEYASDSAPATSVAPATPFAIGYMPNGGGFQGGGTYIATLFYSRVLSQAELDSVYVQMKKLLALYSVAI